MRFEGLKIIIARRANMAVVPLVRRAILDGRFTDHRHRQHGKAAGLKDPPNLGNGRAVVGDVFEDVGGVDQIVAGIPEGELLDVHLVIDAMHVQIGGLVGSELAAKVFREELLRCEVKEAQLTGRPSFEHPLQREELDPVPFQGPASRAHRILAQSGWIVRVVARFTLRSAIELHYNVAEPMGLYLNPVMTFFFGNLYFTYHINRIMDIKQATRYRNAAIGTP